MPDYHPGSSRAGSASDPRIGAELRRFREGQEISGDSVAAALRWSPSKVSRYERGRTALKRREVAKILAYYQEKYHMPRGQAETIMAMFDQAAEIIPFQHPWLGPAVNAGLVRDWAPSWIPRLLQVHRYAAAVLADMQGLTGMSPGEIRSIAAAIAKWQARLHENPPVRLRAVLDESVLYRMAGDAETMRVQLQHLEQAAAAEDTDIEIRVLPYAAARYLPRWMPAFSYLEYPQMPGADDTASIMTEELEGPGQPGLSERAVWKRHVLWAELWDAADEPGTYIKRALTETWT
jgi:transcriptional regulator with XRE-family HTH domain